MTRKAITALVALATTICLHGCSVTEASEPAYDYAGPDGTLTGVPYSIQNYVVEDHDTGVYYFLLLNGDNMALCPRYNADGTLWTNPLHEEAR
jgi:hypothetical protein